MSKTPAAPTFYEILGVDPSADDKTIRQAYLKLSLKHHPDKNPDNPEAAKAKFCVIGRAYEVLSDPMERAKYDRELRRSGSSAASSASASSSQPQYQYYYEHTSQDSYESYQDAFDATVAGMSEAELAAAIGAVSAVAGVVGSILGSRLGGGGKGGAASSFLSTAGSLVGSMVASHVAGEAARTLHAKSIERITYKEEVRRAVARGEPIPQPPPKAGWEEALERTMGGIKNSTTTSTHHSSSTNRGSASMPQTERPSWQDQFKTAVDAAKTSMETAAAKRMAENFIDKVRKDVTKGSKY
jgi:curved DNA-binding protein CbpA